MTEPSAKARLSAEIEVLIARVADEFEARRARGEDPDPEEYAARHPEVADEIRGVLGLFGPASIAMPSDDGNPAPLGDYRIVRELGRGGMGVVYEAEQLSLRRRVALKVLPFAAVMDPRALQRFRNEALAAAGLDHPNVVKVYGVGSERGVHFIALQLVDGRSLADLIRERRGERFAESGRTHTRDHTVASGGASRSGSPSRTPADAAHARRVAEWGTQAADALEHAHALGVVHRDVKPGNLLVDGRGCLYVADFGLARVAADPGATGTGDLLGTPRYMSPEQAAARHGLVDPRSDVYSLGATLYELLTLEPVVPGADRAAVLQAISDRDPTPPRKVDPRVPRDLETVVSKCLEKDPARRYQSAKELGDDLRRFLADRPIRAKRPSLGDRLTKWAARHRPLVSTGVAAVAAVAAALAMSVLLVGRAYRAESDERGRAEENSRAAAEEKKKADDEREVAEATLDLFLNKVIAQADPGQQAEAILGLNGPAGVGRADLTLRAALDLAAGDLSPERLESRFPGRPLVQTRVLQVVGDTHIGVGEYEQAINYLIRALDLQVGRLPSDDPVCLKTLTSLAGAYSAAGRPADAIRIQEQLRDLQEARLGPDHRDTLAALNNLAAAYHAGGRHADAIGLWERVRVAQAARPDTDPLRAPTTLNNLGVAHLGYDRGTEAVELFEQALAGLERARGPDHPDTLLVLVNLTSAYTRTGRAREAVARLERDRGQCEATFGSDHPSTLLFLRVLAEAYWKMDRRREAVSLLEDVHPRVVARLGPDHPQTVDTLLVLADSYLASGRPKDVLRLVEPTSLRLEKAHGPKYPRTLWTLVRLARAHRDSGAPDRAITLFERVLAALNGADGSAMPDAVEVLNDLGVVYQQAHRPKDAVQVLEEARGRAVRDGRPDHSKTLDVLQNLAVAYGDTGREAEGAEILKRILAQQQTTLGPDHQETLFTLSNLAGTYLSLGRNEATVHLLEPVLPRFVKLWGPDNLRTLVSTYNLAEAYTELGRYEEAIPMLEGVVAVAPRVPGPFAARLVALARQTHKAACYRSGCSGRHADLRAGEVAEARKRLPPDSLALADQLAELGTARMVARQPAEAEAVFRESLEIQEKSRPGSWLASVRRFELAEALTARAKYDEAESLLLKAYASLRDLSDKLPLNARNYPPWTADRLAALYDATRRPDLAARWRAERKTYPPDEAPPPREKR